jgi:hypothetical protein
MAPEPPNARGAPAKPGHPATPVLHGAEAVALSPPTGHELLTGF